MTAVRAIGLSIEETARLLVHAGYNVIFVNESKMPIGIEEYAKYYDEHMTEDFINEYVKKALRRAKGIALLGNINPWFPDKRLVIIDVDNPWTWDDVKQRLPQELANKIEARGSGSLVRGAQLTGISTALNAMVRCARMKWVMSHTHSSCLRLGVAWLTLF